MSDYIEKEMTVVLSAVQLAAIFAGETVSETATITNRLLGAVRLIGGVVELIGAGALCSVPEPTLLSKAGCVIVGVHGADTFTTGFQQVRHGTPHLSLTERTASSAAKAFGADMDTAATVGLVVDIAVPISFAGVLSAFRIGSIRAGRIYLSAHEAQVGSGVGGHTIVKHVAKSEEYLRARLARELTIPAAGSFSTVDVAERAISKAVLAKAKDIQDWARTATPSSRPKAFEYAVGSEVGYGVVRASNQMIQMTKIRIVFKFAVYNGMPYYILTSYPIP